MSSLYSVRKMKKSNGGGYSILIEGAFAGEFAEAIRRATNCWPDASPTMKAFADMVTNGEVLQDYEAQTGKQRPEG